jgi:carboxymethylenebutenolidase
MLIVSLVLIFWPPVSLGAAQTSSGLQPQIVEIPSGSLHLKGLLWRPSGAGPFPAVLFSHGSGGPDPDHTAGLTNLNAAERLAHVFLKHGYAFLYLFRRGQGLSADQAPFMPDLLRKEEQTHGEHARQRLQLRLLTTDQLDDVLAGVAFLKTSPVIDPARVALIGHSFGGQLAILANDREPNLRAVVAFAAAANSWESSPQLRERLLAAVRAAHAPVMLIHAQNDFSIAPGKALNGELEKVNKPHVLKIYPAAGSSAEEGHNFIYTHVSVWEADVFRFLDSYLKP